jgi:hypothetical protein
MYTSSMDYDYGPHSPEWGPFILWQVLTSSHCAEEMAQLLYLKKKR